MDSVQHSDWPAIIHVGGSDNHWVFANNGRELFGATLQLSPYALLLLCPLSCDWTAFVHRPTACTFF